MCVHDDPLVLVPVLAPGLLDLDLLRSSDLRVSLKSSLRLMSRPMRDISSMKVLRFAGGLWIGLCCCDCLGEGIGGILTSIFCLGAGTGDGAF